MPLYPCFTNGRCFSGRLVTRTSGQSVAALGEEEFLTMDLKVWIVCLENGSLKSFPIQFPKELAHIIVEAWKSGICRAGQLSRVPGKS